MPYLSAALGFVDNLQGKLLSGGPRGGAGDELKAQVTADFLPGSRKAVTQTSSELVPSQLRF